MAVTTLWISNFRCFEEVVFEPDPAGLTVLRGENGVGKTTVLEALCWLSTQRSFRGASRDALVRSGTERAVLRAQTVVTGRNALVEAELPYAGPARAQVNRQPVRRRADLAEALAVSVFSPDDLELVQGPPARRRDYLDNLLLGRHPRYESLVSEVERILRQRAAVLRQAGARHDPAIEATLDVWDTRLAASGDALAAAREELTALLSPLAAEAHTRLAAADEPDLRLRYRRSWDGPLAASLAASRHHDLHRQVTSLGPHRDDLEVTIGDRPARAQASQGEQRSAALSLRLAAHRLAMIEHDTVPVLLLDDVFSELDLRRAEALVEQLPPGQVILTTAVDPPPVVRAERVVEVIGGRLAGAGARRVT